MAPGTQPADNSPFETLGISRDSLQGLSLEQQKMLVNGVARALSAVHHPDKTGDATKQTAINGAKSDLLDLGDQVFKTFVREYLETEDVRIGLDQENAKLEERIGNLQKRTGELLRRIESQVLLPLVTELRKGQVNVLKLQSVRLKVTDAIAVSKGLEPFSDVNEGGDDGGIGSQDDAEAAYQAIEQAYGPNRCELVIAEDGSISEVRGRSERELPQARLLGFIPYTVGSNYIDALVRAADNERTEATRQLEGSAEATSGRAGEASLGLQLDARTFRAKFLPHLTLQCGMADDVLLVLVRRPDAGQEPTYHLKYRLGHG